jgi:CRISPR/Cas system-associated protein Csm6
MRTINLTNGADVSLDGDLLTMLETLYRELTAKQDLDYSFEDTSREIQRVIDQMTPEEQRQYLSESLFLNFVSYENERLSAYMKKLAKTEQVSDESTIDK